jgi:hypothetical protein
MPLSQVIARKPQWFLFTKGINNFWSHITSLLCKQIEHLIASYLMKIWDEKDCLFDSQDGFRLGYSCEIQAVTVCQDIVDSLGNDDRIGPVIINFLRALDLDTHDQRLMTFRWDSRVAVWIYIYWKIINNIDMKNLQRDLKRLGKWASENEMKINPAKSQAVCFITARVKEPLTYSLQDTVILD